MSNYEHNEGDFVPIKSMLEEASKNDNSRNFSISEILVGIGINNIWGDKVKKVCSSTNTGSGYRNLRKRSCFPEDVGIRTLDNETVTRLEVLSSKHEGWIVDFPNESQFSLLNVPLSQVGTTVDGRRLVCEITGNLDQSNITLRTHGQPVLLNELCHLTYHNLETIIRLLDSTSLCLGTIIVAGNDEGSMKYLKDHVAGSTIVNIKTNNGKEETSRLIATSCLLITSGTRACKNCTYAAKLWHNRETKRNAKGGSLHKKCNVRYLARGGLEEKVCKQRKEIRSDSVREKRAMDEMIEFSESDCVDLRKIVDNVDSKDVPEDMALLWEMQRKQLASKSPAGYRWHPRYVGIYLYYIYALENKCLKCA